MADGDAIETVDRWRGKVDKSLEFLTGFTHDIDKSVTKVDEKLSGKIDTLKETHAIKIDELKTTVTKLVVYCSMGMFVGSALVSVGVSVVIKLVTGKP